MWPFAAALAAALWLVLKPARASEPWPQVIAFLAVAVPMVLLLLPAASLVSVIAGRAEAITGMPLVAVPAVLLTLAFALVLSFLRVSYLRPSWALPAVAFVVSAGLIAWANATSSFDEEHPKTNMVMYALDADTGEAHWLTTSDSLLGRGRRGQLDQWTTQFLGENPEATSVRPWLAQFDATNPGYQADAPGLNLQPPALAVVGDRGEGAERVVELQLQSPRGGLNATVEVKTRVEAATLNGKPIDVEALADRNEALRIVYYAFPEGGVRLSLRVQADGPFEVEVRDWTPGLPAVQGLNVRPRPDHMVPAAFDLTDTTMIKKTFVVP
jgi:hypothetical protein